MPFVAYTADGHAIALAQNGTFRSVRTWHCVILLSVVHGCLLGHNTRVTFENVGEFCARLAHARLEEDAEAVAAVRKGLSDIVPENMLDFFTWRELEKLVCADCSF